ncbi:Na(+)/H(+) antiporter subunit G [Pigmentiphaga humi]|uniref:Na(+)/H(+) antiporter subunit G n=1 Tax=Pigmentiphaga humi TaxID=2478468 RepID=A0A3P4B047_9BURK|nr:monovalent cation/H(+) antiporter subunit G [Pigmentiphaga humi]VCU69679.1 Na(+)/H(+) antiporter subunit G [Pigmentiphaga humi]
MNEAASLPIWAEILTSLLLVGGGLLTLIGCLGLWRFHSFYQRLHGPTLGATMGLVAILLASMLYFSTTDGGPALHEILIAVFLTMTVPATTLMLARAALYRHRRAGKTVPAPQYLDDRRFTTDDIDDEHYYDVESIKVADGKPNGRHGGRPGED